MIEIKHKSSGQVLFTVEANTLQGVNLSGVKLAGAQLVDTDLTGAKLIDTDLTGAILVRSRLTGANLYGAKLDYADVSGTRFLRTNLVEANFANARFYETILIDCKTLYEAKGLDQIVHIGPSTLDARTIRVSIRHLSNTFLKGTGYTKQEIDVLRKMYVNNFKYYSCFISYAHYDNVFATKLHAALLTNNVACWLDVEKMKGGDYWKRQINEAIKEYNKLIIICSKVSLSRPAVVEEIIEGIEYESTHKVRKLFPIKIDDFIFSKEAEVLAYKDLPEHLRRQDWLSYLRNYHMPDFKDWDNEAQYKLSLEKLLEALKMTSRRQKK